MANPDLLLTRQLKSRCFAVTSETSPVMWTYIFFDICIIQNSGRLKSSMLVEVSKICSRWIENFKDLITLFCSCRVNKPYLPIAAGDLSVQSAWFLVLSFAVTGLLIVSFNFGSFITSLYCLGFFLGTIYSVPPFRMKRFPVAAFLIIATVWLVLLFSLSSMEYCETTGARYLIVDEFWLWLVWTHQSFVQAKIIARITKLILEIKLTFTEGGSFQMSWKKE